MIKYNFNIQKASQAASLFLELNDNKLNYMKLIKLLYLLDRAALTKWNEPVTCDSYSSLPHGPVVSNIYDLISTEQFLDENEEWYSHISRAEDDKYSVVLSENAGIDELSQREIDTLKEIDMAFKKYDQWQLRDFCHDSCSEWQDPHGSMIPITIEDILKAVGKSRKEIKEIEEETTYYQSMRELLEA